MTWNLLRIPAIPNEQKTPEHSRAFQLQFCNSFWTVSFGNAAGRVDDGLMHVLLLFESFAVQCSQVQPIS
jgi:hypothetical protein